MQVVIDTKQLIPFWNSHKMLLPLAPNHVNKLHKNVLYLCWYCLCSCFSITLGIRVWSVLFRISECDADKHCKKCTYDDDADDDHKCTECEHTGMTVKEDGTCNGKSVINSFT